MACRSYNTIANINGLSDKVLFRETHKFKDEHAIDKKALKYHFKRVDKDIRRNLQQIQKISEDEREYMSHSSDEEFPAP